MRTGAHDRGARPAAPSFDHLALAARLTDEQRRAATSTAARTLVLAAAGSGKTATLTARVAHALCTAPTPAQPILALAFNAGAAAELRERVQQCLAPGPMRARGVQACTLHALGLSIISRVEGRRPAVLQGGSGAGARLFDQVVADLLATDAGFLDQWLLYGLFFQERVRHPCHFSTRRQWREFVRTHGVVQGRQAGFLTRRGECLPTQFEQAVADWLAMHDLDYVYRRTRLAARTGWQGLVAAPGPLSGRRGFYLPAIEGWVVCLRQRAQGARPVGASVLALDVAQFHRAEVFPALRQWWGVRAGCALPGASAVLTRLGPPPGPVQRRFLLRFLALARLSGRDEAALRAAMASNPDPLRVALHRPLLMRLCAAWNEALDGAGRIDFEGMLRRSAEYLRQGRHRPQWQLILVDEFQDMSAAGLQLLQALLAAQPSCRLFAVGDDWQSIYRFAGALPDVLARFAQYFGAPTVLQLSRTFRFDQSVADAAGAFIRQNPAQLPKRVRARAAGAAPAPVLMSYQGNAQAASAVQACLADIAQRACAQQTHVFLLGRYQHQLPCALGQWQALFPTLRLEFRTIHGVKGLEADAVILLGLHGGRHGFPCEIRSDPLLEWVLPSPETYPHAEERRLFYVALTRTRGPVYLVADASLPSVFVEELQALQAQGQFAMACLAPPEV